MDQIGGYVLEAKLGEGGMGAVYRATHPRFPGRQFALKVLVGQVEPGGEALKRFEREMKALAVATTHPHVVRIFGGAVEGERPYYVMELVEGMSLDALARGTPIEAKRAARILHAVADAVAHVNELGVVHRDLKPANVIIERNDSPRVCDFGLARLADAERLTKTGIFLGTPAFAAPEQLDGRSHEADARTDVYSLGATLYYALTGTPPFTAPSQQGLVRTVLMEPPEPPSRRLAGVPRDLDAICLRALEKDPQDRYQTAAALREELGRFIAGEPIETELATSLDRARRYVRRRRREVAVVALGLALAGVVTPAYFVLRRFQFEAQHLADERIAEALRAPRAAEAAERVAALEKDGPTPAVLEAAKKELERRREALAALVKPFEKTSDTFAKKKGELDDLLDRMARDDLLERLARETAGAPDAYVALAEELLVRRGAVQENTNVSPQAAGPFAAALAKAARAATVVRAAATSPADPAAQLLGVLDAIALRGGPTTAFGPGAPSALAALTPAEKESLARVAKGQGPLAARAAGLLVDATLAAGDKLGAKELTASLAALSAQDKASFERILEAPLDGAGFASFLPAEDPRRAAELARFFVCAGAAGAIDHPEVLTVKPERIAARDPWPTQTFRSSPEAQQRASVVMMDIFRALGSFHEKAEFKKVTPEELAAGFAPIRESFDAKIREGLLLDPKCGAMIFRAATPMRRLLTAGIFLVLATRDEPGGVFELGECFNTEDRGVTRLGYTMEAYAEEVFEMPGDRPWEEYDARLEADMAKDALAQLLPAADRAEAAAVCRALFRLDILAQAADDRRTLDEKTRAQLAFEVLRDTDALRRIGSAGLLPFRARARRLALPGQLGVRLAEVDLRRALTWSVEMRRCREEELDAAVKVFFEQASSVAMVAAAFAAEDPSAVKQNLHFALYDELVKALQPRIARTKKPWDVNFISIRAISTHLRDALEADPKRSKWKEDFEPR